MGRTPPTQCAVNPSAPVVGISGRIAAGKSTIATALSVALECAVFSFGEFVRAKATSVGASLSRESLVAIGQSFVERDCQGFVASAISFADWSPGDRIVIDGIRHKCVQVALVAKAANQQFLHVHVRSSDAVRYRRLRRRQELRDMASLDRDPTEREVTALGATADLVVRGDGEVDTAVSEILDHLHSAFTA